MKKIIVHIVFLLLVPSFVMAAPRGLKVVHVSKGMLSRNAEIKAEMQAPTSEKDRDYLMFTNFVGIVVNFVKLFMDPNNIPEAKQNAYNILNGINNLAHVITRTGLSKRNQEALALRIIELCKNCEVS